MVCSPVVIFNNPIRVGTSAALGQKGEKVKEDVECSNAISMRLGEVGGDGC